MNSLLSLHDSTHLMGTAEKELAESAWLKGDGVGGKATLSPPSSLCAPLSFCFFFAPPLTRKPVHGPNGTFPVYCFFWDNLLTQGGWVQRFTLK